MDWPKTQWALVEVLKSGGEADRQAALGELMAVYGPALFAFARREWRGSLSREDCEDVVSGFFVNCIEKAIFERADPTRGRFRNFVARTFKNFGLNEIRARGAQSRRPSGGLDSLHALLEEHGARLEPRSGESPDDVFVRVLRHSLFVRSLARFKEACASAGQSDKFDMFVMREVAPFLRGAPEPTYGALKVRFGLTSEDAVGRIIRAARTEFDSGLKELVEGDCDSRSDVEHECRLVWACGLEAQS